MRYLLILLTFIILSCDSKFSKKEHTIYWHGKSAEYKALCVQAYNVAKAKLDKELLNTHDKPIAIVADLDLIIVCIAGTVAFFTITATLAPTCPCIGLTTNKNWK